MKRDVLKILEETKETSPEKYVKVAAGLLGGCNRRQFDFIELQKLFALTNTNHLDISFNFLESGFPVEKFDDLFVDEVYFSSKGSSIF
jgi:hypothetical protein